VRPYVVSNQHREDGAHEVHQANSNCGNTPPAFTLRELGIHPCLQDAVNHAARQWPTMRIVGCTACFERDEQNVWWERFGPARGAS
jgi:hypothetical protein